MRFTAAGPNIPNELIDAQERGELLFFVVQECLFQSISSLIELSVLCFNLKLMAVFKDELIFNSGRLPKQRESSAFTLRYPALLQFA
ncbi:hypothetical protein [Acinetobacter soli]|uniref:hypothetical protein n=1 Tax=Acinetobacter soli TaxID=487316 RepID=UPI003A8A8A75